MSGRVLTHSVHPALRLPLWARSGDPRTAALSTCGNLPPEPHRRWIYRNTLLATESLDRAVAFRWPLRDSGEVELGGKVVGTLGAAVFGLAILLVNGGYI